MGNLRVREALQELGFVHSQPKQETAFSWSFLTLIAKSHTYNQTLVTQNSHSLNLGPDNQVSFAHTSEKWGKGKFIAC